MNIRDADNRDAAGIALIYNDAVDNTTAIWNERTVDSADRASWIADRQGEGNPVLVAVDDRNAVLGYASFGNWRAWDGYRFTVEHSVCVRADQRGSGIGAALMAILVDRARQLGKHVMVAAIEADNSASVCLHAKLSFEPSGVLRQVGTKFGTWLDLAFMQLMLDSRPEPAGGAAD